MLGYLAMLFWFPSLPNAGPGGGSLAHLAASLYHLPLYAGLGFFILQTISGGQGLAAHLWTRAVLTFTATGTFAALAEWQRVAVTGPELSPGDFLLDLAGVAGVLLVFALGRAGDSPR